MSQNARIHGVTCGMRRLGKAQENMERFSREGEESLTCSYLERPRHDGIKCIPDVRCFQTCEASCSMDSFIRASELRRYSSQLLHFIGTVADRHFWSSF
mmetsp:Transcript_17386/g.42567  ORF Transcript_17386/g.42567 Transcript_17386/m.42567 type:complete len:99 (+) Transcript_17386:282-578(+)